MSPEQRALYSLAEVVTPARWPAFVDWLEAAEEGGDGVCSHSPMDYEIWLRDQGDTKKLGIKAQAIFDAFGALGKGPCRCNAGAAIWRGNELDDVVFPMLFAAPADLPRALTGLPADLSTADAALYGLFFGAGRGPNTLFAAVPEPPFSGDVKAGMGMARSLAWLARWSPSAEPLVHTADQSLRFFFHSASFDTVQAHYEQVERPLTSFDIALSDLTVFAIQTPDGSAASGLQLHTPSGSGPAGVETLTHLVVARPAEGTILLGQRWVPFPAEGVTVDGPQGSAALVPQEAGLHVVHLA